MTTCPGAAGTRPGLPLAGNPRPGARNGILTPGCARQATLCRHSDTYRCSWEVLCDKNHHHPAKHAVLDPSKPTLLLPPRFLTIADFPGTSVQAEEYSRLIGAWGEASSPDRPPLGGAWPHPARQSACPGPSRSAPAAPPRSPTSLASIRGLTPARPSTRPACLPRTSCCSAPWDAAAGW